MNMGNVVLARICEVQDGHEYGMWAFEGAAPAPAEVNEILEIFAEQGMSDWGIGDIEDELRRRGYVVQFVNVTAQYYI